MLFRLHPVEKNFALPLGDRKLLPEKFRSTSLRKTFGACYKMRFARPLQKFEKREKSRIFVVSPAKTIC